MATLKTVFRLFDGYSSTIDRINRKTDQATDKILKASIGTDDLNNKLEATGASANIANTGLTKLVGTFLSLAAIKKGIDFIDGYTNTDARLNLINDGLQTQLELQDKIFAAADRSRGVYSEMAGAVSKMGLLAGNAFISNDELIAFTELVQKSFKVGGAETSEQQGAMRQLTQAMASGRLQGDEMVSIMENAPLIYQAIEKYMGLSEGELKKLSSEGVISADIIKNAMFMAGEEIEKQFSEMPMTFADIWAKVANGATRAFRPVIQMTNDFLNTEKVQHFIDTSIYGIYVIADGIQWLINTIISGWDIISPIMGAIAIVAILNIVSGLWAMIIPLLIQLSIWQIMYQPILPLIGAIALLIYSLNETGTTVQDVFGFIGGYIGWLIGAFANAGIAITNSFISIMGTIETVVLGAINFILKGVNKIIDALNKIHGVDIGSVGELSGYWQNKDLIDYVSLSDMYEKGSNIGKNTYTGMSDKLNTYLDKFSLGENKFDLSDFGTMSNPLTVQGKVDVDMSDEDLQYLRDIAERDYVNKFSTATLAPNVTISFGDVHEEADADKVAGRIRKILEEELAIVAEGDY